MRQRIALCGLDASEQAFYAKSLPGLKLDFYATPLRAGTLDPATTILSVFVDTRVDKAVIAALPHLRMIACRSTGTDHIDIAAAQARNIFVANVPAYGSATVAEFAFALLLMLTRRMPAVIKQSQMTKPDRHCEQGADLQGKTLGIVGTGGIGMHVARIAHGFGMTVLAFDIVPQQDLAAAIGVRYVHSVPELVGASDVLSLHVPLTPDTRHILDSRMLAMCKPGAYILNVSRGELIDTDALLRELSRGHLGGAGLDVLDPAFASDPAKTARLTALPQVLLTNHNAYNSLEALQRIHKATLHNIQNFLHSQ